jgi:hypothetical protein
MNICLDINIGYIFKKDAEIFINIYNSFLFKTLTN